MSRGRQRLAALAARGTPPAGDPRGAAARLRRVLERKVERLTAGGDLDRRQAEELAKIASALARLEGAGYDLRAAAVEVMGRFASFVARREKDPGLCLRLADLMESFLAGLEGEG
jgi:hypothetical protein